jgi:hypothetical protein
MRRPAKRRNPKGAKRWGLANVPAAETDIALKLGLVDALLPQGELMAHANRKSGRARRQASGARLCSRRGASSAATPRP